ncbi:hypothetical protein GCM10010357_24930 [Streptomyces luteireticuli]|uniref:Uncharacterized protein n=1 Tax=Streptomyces luteireticuli TaxID=173858 RepID=A0ABP3IHF2_9ACTN
MCPIHEHDQRRPQQASSAEHGITTPATTATQPVAAPRRRPTRTGAKCGTAHAGGGTQEGREPREDGPDAWEDAEGEGEEDRGEEEGKGDTATTARRGGVPEGSEEPGRTLPTIPSFPGSR